MPKRIDLDNLFETTVRMFSERGYSGTTTLELAARAGVSEVTLFRRFGNKAVLIQEALLHCFSNVPFSDIEVNGNLREDLLAIVKAYRETNEEYGGAVITLLNDLPSTPELVGSLEIFQSNMMKVAQTIAMYQEQGELRPGNPVQTLIQLLSPMMMMGLWFRGAGKNAAFAMSDETLVDTFLQGHQVSSEDKAL